MLPVPIGCIKKTHFMMRSVVDLQIKFLLLHSIKPAIMKTSYYDLFSQSKQHGAVIIISLAQTHVNESLKMLGSHVLFSSRLQIHGVQHFHNQQVVRQQPLTPGLLRLFPPLVLQIMTVQSMNLLQLVKETSTTIVTISITVVIVIATVTTTTI